MEMIRGNRKLRGCLSNRNIFSGLDLELAPQGVDVFLLIVHAGEFHHVVPHCRMGTVCAEHQVEVHLNLIGAVGAFEPCLACAEVSPNQLMTKEERHVWQALEHVEQPPIEIATVDGEDRLKTHKYSQSIATRPGESTHSAVYVVVLGFFIQVAVWASPVYHATTHGDSALQDTLQEVGLAGVAHRSDAPFRQSQVD